MDEITRDLDRRQFAARVAMGAALAPAALAALATQVDDAAWGQDELKSKEKKPDAAAPKDPLAERPVADKPERPRFNPIAVQLELLVGQYPSEQLTPEGLRIIAGKLASQLAHGARLSSFPLTNADGPGFVFSAYRGE